MSLTLEDIKIQVLALLGHDRWNSGLSDERLAEKIAATLTDRGPIEPASEGVSAPPPSARA